MFLYEEQFSEKHDFPEIEKPSKVLIIASTGRCGSHMLGHALYQTGNFGFPLEYANPANFAEWQRRLGKLDFHDVMAEIQKRRTSPNGVFGIKIHYPHIKQFGGFDGLLKTFPDAHYVLLSRTDVLRQAVSLSIASQTGEWISGQKSTESNPIYDFSHINECLRETIINNASWRYVLSAGGCNYIEMDFDRVRNDLAASIEVIAGLVGIKVDQQKIPERQITKSQSKGINEEWRRRFVSDFDKKLGLLQKDRLFFARKVKRKAMRMIGF